jgi:putative sigma-54 modulation protein
VLFTITGKHIDITDSLKKHAREKTSKLPRYYNKITDVEVLLDSDTGSSNSNNIRVEIIVRGEHNNVFVVNEAGDDAYLTIDLAVKKLERQLTKKKEKERNKKHLR